MPRSTKPPTGFLNVDLEVGARTRAVLDPLTEALRASMSEIFHGRIRGLFRGHYEISSPRHDPSHRIHALASVIEQLRGPARKAWNATTWRDFNVGVDLERGVRSVELAIDADAVRRVAALGGRIAFTAYQVAAIKIIRIPKTS